MTEREKDLPVAERIRFRIGINLGDVIRKKGDLYGDGVNIAAHLEKLAEPGGIAVSGTAYDQMHGKLDLPLAFAGEQRVRNMERPVRVYRVLLDGRAAAWGPASQSWWQGRAAGAAVLALLLVAAVAGGWWWHERQAAPGQPAATAGLPVPDSRGAEKLYLAPEKPEITPKQIDATLGPSEWRAIQDALRDLGCYQGVTNGRPSYAVRTAIWEFQLAQGATGSGYRAADGRAHHLGALGGRSTHALRASPRARSAARSRGAGSRAARCRRPVPAARGSAAGRALGRHDRRDADEMPVLGAVDGWSGLLVATGFSGHGFGIGPAAGYLMAQLARGERPVVDLAPFRLARFAEGNVRRYPAGM
jgi:hypothetical protein